MTVAGPSVPGVHLVDTSLGDRLSTLVLFSGPDSVLQLDTGVDGTTSAAVLPALGFPEKNIRLLKHFHIAEKTKRSSASCKAASSRTYGLRASSGS